MTLLAMVLSPQHPAPHRIQALRTLLDRGANPNLAVHVKLPLDLACRVGPEAVALLLEHGADPNRRTSAGAPVYFTATGLPVPVAALKLMLDHGADVDAVDREGRTAAVKAAGNWNWYAVVLLLRSGAAWNATLTEQVREYRTTRGTDDSLAELVRYLERQGASLLP